jgi:hypothetical protein
MHPVRVLWSAPRTASTAFERMVIERGDHIVFDEPFSRHYYFGPDKVSDRYDEVLPDSSPGDILRSIEAAATEAPVFVKDMAYHAVDVVDPTVLGRFSNTFLVRHPAAALASLERVWPDFTDEEAGYDALARMVRMVAEAGQPVTVIDSDDLLADPASVIADWCERSGIPFLPEALTWEAGMQPQWELWAEWHEGTATSTGFGPPRPTPRLPDPGTRLGDLCDRWLPLYRELTAGGFGVS